MIGWTAIPKRDAVAGTLDTAPRGNPDLDKTTMKILIAVDGSKHSLNAVKCLLEHADWYREYPAVELVYVHLPVPRPPRMGLAVSPSQVRRYYDREGKAALSKARKLLDAKGIEYAARIF